MSNYININNQKIDLTEDQVEQIRSALGLTGFRLSDAAVGDTVRIGRREFVVLEHSGDTTALILKNLLLDKKEFGENNRYEGSYVDDVWKS